MRKLPILIAVLFCVLWSSAEDQRTSMGEVSPDALRGEFEALRKKIGDDSEIVGEKKDQLEKLLTETDQLLTDSRNLFEEANRYREAFRTGPDRVAELNARTKAVPKVGTGAETVEPLPAGELEVLEKSRIEQQNRVAALSLQLADFSAKLEALQARDSEEILRRLEVGRANLVDGETRLAGLEPAVAANGDRYLYDLRRLKLEAGISAERNRITALEQERISQSSRAEVLRAEVALTQAELEEARGRLSRLEEVIAGRRQEMAAESKSTAAQAKMEGDSGTSRLAAEVESLSQSLSEATAELDALRGQRESATSRLDAITENFTDVRSQLGKETPAREFALILLNEHRSLPKTGEIEKSVAERRLEISKTRARLYELERKKRLETGKQEPGDDLPAIERELREKRRQLIEQLGETYRSLNTGRVELSATEQSYLAEVERFRKYLFSKLFWVASSSPMYESLVPDLRDSFLQTAREISSFPSGGIRRAWNRSSDFFTVTGILLAGCLVCRFAISRRMKRIGNEIARISRDTWLRTIEAIALTVLMALPVPLLVLLFARFFKTAGNTAFSFALSEALTEAAPVFFVFAWLINLSRKEGLLEKHFDWDPRMLGFLRRNLITLALLYLPLTLIASIGVKWGQVAVMDGSARLAFILAMLWSSFVLLRMLDPRRPLAQSFLRSRPDSWISHLRNAWYGAAVSIPAALAIMAALGFFLTAHTLHLHLQESVIILALAPVFYGIASRACAVHERRIAFHRSLAERNSAGGGEREESPETPQWAEQMGVQDDAGDKPVDLEVVGEQTRHLLRFLTLVLVGWGIWVVWSGLNETLDTSASAENGFGWGTLLRAVVALVVTFVAARDIPGTLEFLVLRNTPLGSGARDAVKTITSYVIIAIGLAVTFEILNVDWSKFGWIAAALSVGLGFGLQEVVANFVCGLILLFERPLRKGDIVTIGDVTGVVTRLQIRSTTITNWDQKEYIVPNKEFITGTLLNWTLTNSVNRVVIPVGIAYGSDVDRAREILLDICARHPEITDDPTPLATFESFGDSSLNLVLRCYLPTLDKRLKTINELHTEIHRRFAESGIEIPFPQRDLHLRGSHLEALVRRYSGDGPDRGTGSDRSGGEEPAVS